MMPEDAPDQVAEKTASPIASNASAPQENPFANIILNVLAPVFVLSYLSEEDGRFWHVGPMWAMIVALAIPIGYGLWHYITYRQMNVFSVVGLFSVVLTGAITIYLWSGGESVRECRPALGYQRRCAAAGPWIPFSDHPQDEQSIVQYLCLQRHDLRPCTDRCGDKYKRNENGPQKAAVESHAFVLWSLSDQ